MPRQTLHESELEVYRAEIKRLTKALGEIADMVVDCANPRYTYQTILNINNHIYKTLNPALPEPTNQHLIKNRAGLDKGEI